MNKKDILIIPIGAILILATLLTGCINTSTNTGGSSGDVGIPPSEITKYAAEWPLANKDYNNTRATTDSTINSNNVNTLNRVWSYEIKGIGAFGGATTNPVILDNKVYFQDLKGNVVVLDLDTGNEVWTKMYNDSGIVGPNGVGVGYEKVFLAKDLYNISALNMSTGEELWSTRISYIATTGIDIQPTVYDGMVYTATVPGTGDVFYAAGGIGVIYALNQETGKIMWNFSTVKDGKLWGHPEVNSGGGCWYPPSIDTTTGTMFWASANPAPFAGVKNWPSGSSFEGETLYADTLLALNHQTGELNWYSQALAHDIWDHDLQISPILAKENIAGVEQNIVIAAGKMGNVYAFNRETGCLLWKVPVGTHLNDYLDPISEETKVYPGVIGGVETNMAYKDGVVYVPVVNMHTNYTPTGYNASSINFGAGTGELVAINAQYGHIIWKQDLPSLNVGAATVVNDVVFTADYSGMIYAFDAKTGEELLTYQAPAGINGWPAVTKDMIIWPCGVGTTPSMIALKLNGTPIPKTPSITISSPLNGATITGNSTTVKVQVSNFDIVDKLGQSNVNGQGHIHYFLDVTPPTTPGQPATTAQGTYVATTDTSYTWTNLSPGQHTFAVELVNNDHTPLEPAVTDSVTVTLQEQSSSSGGGSITIDLSAKNIAFNRSTITVPAGAQVTINFKNEDAGIPHNFAVYDTSAAQTTIFKGNIITGVSSTTYTFTAPTTPGTYFFRCDVHPNQMNGNFIVE